MIPGVQSFGRPPDDSEKHLLTPDQLRAQLTCVRSSKAVVVLLVDLLDASGSFFSNVRQLVGANPIVIVGTKVRVAGTCSAGWLPDAPSQAWLAG